MKPREISLEISTNGKTYYRYDDGNRFRPCRLPSALTDRFGPAPLRPEGETNYTPHDYTRLAPGESIIHEYTILKGVPPSPDGKQSEEGNPIMDWEFSKPGVYYVRCTIDGHTAEPIEITVTKPKDMELSAWEKFQKIGNYKADLKDLEAFVSEFPRSVYSQYILMQLGGHYRYLLMETGGHYGGQSQAECREKALKYYRMAVFMGQDPAVTREAERVLQNFETPPPPSPEDVLYPQ